MTIMKVISIILRFSLLVALVKFQLVDAESEGDNHGGRGKPCSCTDKSVRLRPVCTIADGLIGSQCQPRCTPPLIDAVVTPLQDLAHCENGLKCCFSKEISNLLSILVEFQLVDAESGGDNDGGRGSLGKRNRCRCADKSVRLRPLCSIADGLIGSQCQKRCTPPLIDAVVTLLEDFAHCESGLKCCTSKDLSNLLSILGK
ncbi:hypothetical protein Bhyg_12348 [Pseudolycoriella hygida]|uniref:Uncharacterized protein n=1 Tax=Pseudolycoriella hygida TaxID=35572 RepID=A0A9Q0S0S5_9DIPT|nr:hypothetical protein Bhyg_12348 [Pseudolycoriella hygida]